MPTVLLIFEFLGTTELLVIAVVALIIFGPRKLPEIGRSVGKSIAEFKRASDDFKRTWEYEVEIESRKPALDASRTTDGQEVASVSPTTEHVRRRVRRNRAAIRHRRRDRRALRLSRVGRRARRERDPRPRRRRRGRR